MDSISGEITDERISGARAKVLQAQAATIDIYILAMCTISLAQDLPSLRLSC